VLLVFEEKAEDPPMKAQSENKERRSKKQRKNGPPLDLLPRLFDRMKRGVWFRVLPTEDTFDDICDAMSQDWDDLLPLLIDHGLLACDIRDGDVKNYKFITNVWEMFQMMHRETLDMRRTPVTRVGVPVIWYICLGNPEYDNPRHQEKAIKQKKFSYWEFDSSPQDKLLARELRAKAKEIHLSNAMAQIEKAKHSKEKDEARDKVLQQESDPSKFEEAITYGLSLDLERTPRLNRMGVKEIEIGKRMQANKQERVMVLFHCQALGLARPLKAKT
jgi:hypothetical protein